MLSESVESTGSKLLPSSSHRHHQIKSCLGWRQPAVTPRGRSWVILRSKPLRLISSHFLPSFTHTHSRNKGKCFRRKDLGHALSFSLSFFSPHTRDFSGEGKGVQNKAANKGLGTVYVRTPTSARKCQFLISCSSASPAGATDTWCVSRGHPEHLGPSWAPRDWAPGYSLWSLWGRAPWQLGPQESKTQGQQTHTPISRSNYDRLLQKKDLT